MPNLERKRMTNLVELSPVGRLRQANKAQVAEFFETSIKAVDGWIRKGCPVVKRGNRSEPWVIDILAVAEWRFTGKEPGAQQDPDEMTPQDRKAWFESETKRRDLQERDRELIPYHEAERTIAVAFAAINQDLRAIPDNLERRAGISGEVAELLEMELFAAMETLADRLSTLTTVESSDDE
jgi:phage terminase Nu1 subunit (DNA packaging protein)